MVGLGAQYVISWTSPECRDLVLGTIIPTSFILSAILVAIVRTGPFPKPVKRILNALCAPFHNFLSPEEVMDSKSPTEARTMIERTRTLSILALLASAGWIGCTVYGLVVKDIEYVFRALSAFVSWAYVCFVTAMRPPTTAPLLFIAFAASHILFYLVESGFDLVKSGELNSTMAYNVVGMFVPGIFVWIAGTLPLQAVKVAHNIAGSKDVPSVTHTCPEDDTTFWSWCNFSFVEPIFDLAMKRTLNESDVWTLSPYFQHKNIFSKCLEYRSLYPTHSLLRFLVVSNSLDLILDVLFELWKACVGFVPSYALKEILAALATGDRESRITAYFWTLMTFMTHLSQAQVDILQVWHTRRCYERTRGQLFCAIHYKSLRRQDLSGHVDQDKEDNKSADLGKIINLMQGDTYTVAQRFWNFSGVFTSPVRLIIALVFLYQVLGWSALSGVGVIIITYALNYPLATFNISVTRFSWKARDLRMNIVNELFQNIRFLKFYGWEYHWAGKAENSREGELHWRVKQNIVDTLISFIWTWMPSATALTSFFCYTFIAQERLTVSKAFTSIALFSQLQEPMTALPEQIFALLHAYVSMQRIEGFLDESEVPEWASSLTATADAPKTETGFLNATFEWPSMPKSVPPLHRFKLGPLNITFPKGKLTLISGPTGSGKSALLLSMLGEMACTSGSVVLNKLDHRVAYSGQNSWLEHATIRDNIIYGSAYGFDVARYQAVLEACALVKDLQVLEAGDQTEIGEKGITLSGGQRARVSLARAMYSTAECILLDDPLAAVDMHTAQHLLNSCLAGPLARNRTIILVTHHINLCLPAASYLVELSQGKVLVQGSIQDLRDQDLLETVIEQEDIPIDVADEADDDGEPTRNPVAESSQRQRTGIGSGKLIEVEGRAEGRVPLNTYLTYVRAAGLLPWICTIALMLFIRFINIANQVFLAQWGEAYESESTVTLVLALSYPWSDFPSPDTNVKPWLMVYFYISFMGALSVLFYIGLGYYASLQASRSLFITLLKRLIRAPARFFDITPIGRILNRFTTDINTIDQQLMNSARACVSGILNFLASFIVILVVIPSFAPFALFIAWLYIRLAPPYIQASRDLRRLESIALSPTFAGYDELLRGISHIRAFGMEQRYQDQFYAKIDKCQSFDHAYWLVNAWLRWRYDCLGSVVVFTATIFALWSEVTNGSTAIVIVQAGIFAEASRQLVKVMAQLELDFNSVERVVEYLDVPQEAPATIEKNRPPAYWPSNSGDLRVENLVVRYAPHLPPVLTEVSLTVKAGERIGVVGRTGSGKSTLALSLLRMIEPAGGSIYIDGIDITTIGLEDLRTRLTIISQDVALFSGTIKSNLDPLDEYIDTECLEVLERCRLSYLLDHKPSMGQTTPLDLSITPNSLSAGEKQLLSIARAILRRTNIIIMDEATSQIDTNLDDM
ncbi:ATP-dependent bile acid permease, partial [Termitomyces sp. T112]